MSEFEDRIYKELATVQDQRIKLSVLKITFITGLLGVGALKLTKTDWPVGPAIYLAPLVAVLFDILGMNATISIKRIGAFLRIGGNGTGEEQWQKFLGAHPSSFGSVGSIGFTMITFLAAVMVLFEKGQWIPLWLVQLLWFGGIFIVWCFFRRWERYIRGDLAVVAKLDNQCDYSLPWVVCQIMLSKRFRRMSEKFFPRFLLRCSEREKPNCKGEEVSNG